MVAQQNAVYLRGYLSVSKQKIQHLLRDVKSVNVCLFSDRMYLRRVSGFTD